VLQAVRVKRSVSEYRLSRPPMPTTAVQPKAQIACKNTKFHIHKFSYIKDLKICKKE
jgi:hypothetical protein